MFYPDYAYLKQLIDESVEDPANKWAPAVKGSISQFLEMSLFFR
jgi:hypothetical protein